MESITVGAKIKLNVAGAYSEKPVGSTATIIYIDEHDMVYIEWSDGKLTSYTEGQLRKSFVPAKKCSRQCRLHFCYMISKWFFLHRINLSRCILLSSLESTERSTLR